MKGFVTLLSTNDYTIAVRTLLKSFKQVKSEYPLIVAVTEDISLKNIDLLRSEGAIIEYIKKESYPDQVKKYIQKSDYFRLNTASKISVFSLKKYEKLCYIDSDVILLKNIDELLNYYDGSMVKFQRDSCGFSGLFVFVPKNHNDEYYSKIIREELGFDGKALGWLLFPCKDNPDYQIPEEYLYFNTQYDYNQQYGFLDKNHKVKVIHYCNEGKPWDPKKLNDINKTPSQIEYEKILKIL